MTDEIGSDISDDRQSNFVTMTRRKLFDSFDTKIPHSPTKKTWQKGRIRRPSIKCLLTKFNSSLLMWQHQTTTARQCGDYRRLTDSRHLFESTDMWETHISVRRLSPSDSSSPNPPNRMFVMILFFFFNISFSFRRFLSCKFISAVKKKENIIIFSLYV